MRFIITYIEDNELGVYKKQIILEADNIFSLMDYCKDEYPTVYEVQELRGTLTREWEHYYTHEAQDQIQRSYREMGR